MQTKSKIVKKYVLFSDICSSTSILEDLIRTENEERWWDVLISLNEYLDQQCTISNYENYKFVGDGWILLLDIDYNGEELLMTLKEFCNTYQKLFNKHIKPVLGSTIENIGISFGLDKGTLSISIF